MIAHLTADAAEARLPELAALLHACVLDGASVGFILPFGMAQAQAFWTEKALPPLRAGSRVLLAAEADGRIVGSAQLSWDTPANQPHRAEVSKLLVRPDQRRRGIARALMTAIEAEARARRRTLLTLDTRTGDAAEPLYLSLGFAVAGVIPGYCLDPDGVRIDGTTIMYRHL
ncbi:MAG: ribosomal protein S18 acetylase RimI-like enzyme [Paracoccaceae bacterium]|jgi:ribosomal protein S18 acetylase RimI-like enzyme